MFMFQMLQLKMKNMKKYLKNILYISACRNDTLNVFNTFSRQLKVNTVTAFISL